MIHIIRIFINVIYVLSLCAAMILWVVGAIYEIVGHAKYEQILSAIGISNGFKYYWIIAVIVLGCLFATFYMKKKFKF